MKDQLPPKKLTRSRSDRFIGGVAAGIADRFDVDPVFVRIAFLVSLAFGGLGLLAYVVLLAVMPVEGDPSEPLPAIEPRRRNLMIGLAAIVGVLALATADSGAFAAWIFGFWPGTVFGVLFWVAAAGVAVWLLATGAFGRDRDPTDPGRPTPTPPRPSPEAKLATPSPEAEPAAQPSSEGATYADSPTQLSRTEVMETRQMASASTDPGTAPEGSDTPVRDDGPSTMGKIMTWFAIGLAGLIVVGILFVFSAGVTAMFGGVPMAALVIALGGGMIFAALRGRRQLSLWLLAAAVAVTVPMAAVSIADLRIEGSYGEIRETPTTALEVPGDGYQMAAGNMTIDLRRFDFDSGPGSGRALELPVESGMGLTSVIVPDDVCVTGTVQGKAGVIAVRGRQSNGIDVTRTLAAPAPPTPGSRLARNEVRIDGDFKLGAFEVVDNTQWRQDGRGGSFEDNDFEPDDRSSVAARERADTACSTFTTPRSETTGKRAGP